MASVCRYKVMDEMVRRFMAQKPFFTEARELLKKWLSLYTRIAMRVVDEGPGTGYILHYKL